MFYLSYDLRPSNTLFDVRHVNVVLATAIFDKTYKVNLLHI